MKKLLLMSVPLLLCLILSCGSPETELGIMWLVIGFIAIVVAVGAKGAKKLEREKAEEALKKDLYMDELLAKSSGSTKVFRELINTPITISENGEIGILDPILKTPKFMHIKDINGFELVIDGKNIANVGGAVVGGLLFGGVGAIIGGSAHNKRITKMNLLLKVNDFKNPTIDIPLYSRGTASWTSNVSPPLDAVQREVQELMATLEFVEKSVKG